MWKKKKVICNSLNILMTLYLHIDFQFMSWWVKKIKVRRIKNIFFVRAKPRTDPVTNIDFHGWRGKKTNVFLASIWPPILFGTFGTEFVPCRLVFGRPRPSWTWSRRFFTPDADSPANSAETRTVFELKLAIVARKQPTSLNPVVGGGVSRMRVENERERENVIPSSRRTRTGLSRRVGWGLNGRNGNRGVAAAAAGCVRDRKGEDDVAKRLCRRVFLSPRRPPTSVIRLANMSNSHAAQWLTGRRHSNSE